MTTQQLQLIERVMKGGPGSGGGGAGKPQKQRSSLFDEIGVIDSSGKVQSKPMYKEDVHDSVFGSGLIERFRTVLLPMGRVEVIWSTDRGKQSVEAQEAVSRYFEKHGKEVVRQVALSQWTPTKRKFFQQQTKSEDEALSGGEVSPLSPDEKLFRKAVAMQFKGQLSEVHEAVKSGKVTTAVRVDSKAWDNRMAKAVEPVWFRLFKRGGDKALKEVKRFGKAARKMVVLSREMIEEAEAVEFKGGSGSGHFGHSGGDGSGPGGSSGGGLGGGTEGIFHGTSLRAAKAIMKEGLKLSESAIESGIYATPSKQLALNYALTRTLNTRSKVPVEDRVAAVLKVSEEGFTHRTDVVDPVMGQHLERQSRTNVPPESIFSIELFRYGDCVKGGRVIPNPVPFKVLSKKVTGHFFVPIDFELLEKLGNAKENKSLKAKKPISVVIPEWIEDPEVLKALEREMYKFARDINQTTADLLRDELITGMENGETIGQLKNRISELSDEWAEGWRSEMIARTETARAYSVGRTEAWKSTGVVSRKIWHAAGDACPFCLAMEGKAVGLSETFFDEGEGQDVKWRGHTLHMDHGYADVEGPPLHPNCITDGNVPVFTSKGWKPIRDIKEHELVLTHKGRFRKVTKTIRSVYGAGTTKITFGRAGRYLTVTDNHPVLVNGKWIAAQEIKKGDLLSVLGRPCARCGIVTMLPKYCSGRCCGLDTTDKQWSNPKHRKNISQKAQAQLKREYADGTRDRFEVTKGMNEAMRKLGAKGLCPLQRPEVRDKIRLVTNTPGQRRRFSIRMQKRNPSFIPEVRKRMTASYKRTMILHPEKHPNMVMAQNGFMSSIERKVKELLDTLGIKYIQQHPVDRFFVDFAIPSLNVAIEVDGHYWHKDELRDKERQNIIESKGWHVVRFGEDRINEDLDSVSQELSRIAANHAGEYQFAEVKVLLVERRNLKRPRSVYNLSVEEDESYIAKGLVVHNCRCVLIAELSEEGEKMFMEKENKEPQETEE